MATPIQGVLKTPPTQPKTVVAASATHTQSTAALTASTATLIQAPLVTGPPSKAIPAGSYTSSVTIVNPTDGKLVYIGQDGTVNPQGGHALYPGNSLMITGYLGDVWVTSSNGVAPLFFTAV